MEHIIFWTPWVVVVHGYLMAFIMTTSNWQSAIFFKMIPFGMATASLLIALKSVEVF